MEELEAAAASLEEQLEAANLVAAQQASVFEKVGAGQAFGQHFTGGAWHLPAPPALLLLTRQLGAGNVSLNPPHTCLPLPSLLSCLQLGAETMTLKDALKVMKQQAADMAIRSQRAAEEAAWERAEADARYAGVTAELEAERSRITTLEVRVGRGGGKGRVRV